MSFFALFALFAVSSLTYAVLQRWLAQILSRVVEGLALRNHGNRLEFPGS